MGLGNPSTCYTWTRHNIGFMVIDHLAKERNISFQPNVGCLLGFDMGVDKRVILVKPQTFMNNSGDVIKTLFAEFECLISELVVVHDDLDLNPGRIKIQYGGGAGGHGGVGSIIQQLMDDRFTRVRIGIGRPPVHIASADYVLSLMAERDRREFNGVARRGADAVRCLVSDGRTRAMNRFNSRKSESSIAQ